MLDDAYLALRGIRLPPRRAPLALSVCRLRCSPFALVLCRWTGKSRRGFALLLRRRQRSSALRARSFHLKSTARSVHLKSTARSFHLKSTARRFQRKSTARSVHLKSTARSVHLKSTARSFRLKSTARSFHLKSTDWSTALRCQIVQMTRLPEPEFGLRLYGGTSSTRKHTHLEPYRRPMPKVLGWS